MNKYQKTWNKFSSNHAGLRKFLRLMSYGCYHRTLFSKHEITPRTYDDTLRQVRFIMPEKNLQVTRYDKCSYFTLIGDFRHGTKNFYVASFFLKTLKAEQLLCKIIVLQVLKAGETLSAAEIINRGVMLLNEHDPNIESGDTDLPQRLRRRLKELTTSGLLRRTKENFYEKIPNPLGELSADEIKILSFALKFFRNVSLLGTVGYFLCDSLKDIYGMASDGYEIFQFKNNDFARVLDDDILLAITAAINGGKKILVKRESKSPITVTPLAIETDFLYSRQYLVALWQKDLMRLRVEKILEVKILNDEAEKFSPPKEKLREVKLRVKFKDADERYRREKILSEELSARIVTESPNEFICVIETPDPLRIYPQLWKFQPWAEILTENLRERMKADALEALKNYADSL